MLGSSQELPEFDNPNKLIRESGRKFKVELLPNDLQRVYKHLEEQFGEEYALTVVFTVRTADSFVFSLCDSARLPLEYEK